MMPLPGHDLFCQELFALDEQACREMKSRRCPACGSPLDIANIPRKPREYPETIRFGLCCRKDGCRKRVWPPSVRFFGRKVYSAWTVILAVDFNKSYALKIPYRTLARWRQLWRERLAEGSQFMRWARSRGSLPISSPGTSPKTILAAFGFPKPESMLPALKFFTQC